MSLKYLGDTLDIHGGGQDLVFPHHENEIAQSESFTGVKPFVKYWLHNGLVQLGEDKMSKSLGNLITIKEALERYSADAIRIFVLSSHYHNPLTYSEEALEAAARGAERLRQAASGEGRGEEVGKRVDTEPYQQRFTEAMDDDFNTPQAIATLFDLAREINKYDSEGIEAGHACDALAELGRVLGLTFEEPKPPDIDIESLQQLLISINQWRLLADLNEIPVGKIPDDAESLMELINSTRSALRDKEQWEYADKIRSRLVELNIALEDTVKGTVWKHKR
jgi:cysteinyl-tRNA synthetase